MASSVTTDYLSSILKVMMFDFDPDETTHTDVSWQDFRDFGAGLMTVMHSVGTGSVNAFSVLGNTASDGSDTDATIKTHALGSDPNAVGDYIHLDWNAHEMVNLGTALRYVSGNISLATTTDECVVTYIFGLPRWAYGSLSSDNIS